MGSTKLNLSEQDPRNIAASVRIFSLRRWDEAVVSKSLMSLRRCAARQLRGIFLAHLERKNSAAIRR
jgi:hypothetical protein